METNLISFKYRACSWCGSKAIVSRTQCHGFTYRQALSNFFNNFSGHNLAPLPRIC